MVLFDKRCHSNCIFLFVKFSSLFGKLSNHKKVIHMIYEYWKHHVWNKWNNWVENVAFIWWKFYQYTNEVNIADLYTNKYDIITTMESTGELCGCFVGCTLNSLALDETCYGYDDIHQCYQQLAHYWISLIPFHYSDVLMSDMMSQFTSISSVSEPFV